MMTLGSVLAGAAVTIWAAYWVYCLENPAGSLNTWPSWACALTAAVGLCLVILGALKGRRDSNFIMNQRGGGNSLNVQAGRDAIVEQDSSRGDD
jgi:hypothetical protein